MQSFAKTTCATQGCTAKKARDHQHCWKHLRENEHTIRMSPDMQKNIRSQCCSMPCILGEQHEVGNQYCTKCHEACFWKMMLA